MTWFTICDAGSLAGVALAVPRKIERTLDSLCKQAISLIEGCLSTIDFRQLRISGIYFVSHETYRAYPPEE